MSTASAADPPSTPMPEAAGPRLAIGAQPIPRTRRFRALLCSSTPPQFVEMLRVGRFLKAGDEFEALFWMQMLPHKLAEGVAICEEEGFPYLAHPLGGAVVAPAAAGGAAPAPEFGTTRRTIPFVRESWRALMARPSDPRRWQLLAAALVGRAWLRVRRNVVVGWVNFCLSRDRLRAGWGEKLASGLYRGARGAGNGLVALSRAVSRRMGWRWRGLPPFLRPLAIFPFMALYLLLDRRRLINLTSLLAAYRSRNRAARATLVQLQPDLIVVAEDSLYDYASFIAEGWWRGIPTVVVPYTISTAAEPAETILGSPELHTDYTVETWPGRLAARLFPQWVYVYKGHTLLRLSPALVLVLEHLRLAPPRPWLFNSGYSVALAAESAHMAELYLREGLGPEYVVLTGALYDDAAAAVSARRAEKRRALLQETGLPARRRLVVCALPPRMEIDRRAGCEFATHEEIVEFMLAPLVSMPDTAVAISLHPTLKLNEMRYVEKWGARISTWGVADLISCSDLFVASISATIRIAIAGGVPVVNFDVFRYGYRDYEQAPGVVTITTRAEYAEVTRRLRADPSELDALREAQERVASRWGFRDGLSGPAVLDLFEHVIAHKTTRGYVSPHGRPR